jgi:hypothetical protein
MPAQEPGDLLVAFVSIDDSAGVAAQDVIVGMPVPYVFYDDSAAITDYTVQANEATAGDWYMSPTIPTVGDAIYFGSLEQFNGVYILNSVAGVASVNTVWALEYYNGSVWGTLSTLTNTVGANLEFVATVHAEATFTPPANWATVAYNGVTAYWVRWRCTTSSTFGTRPVSTQAWITPVPNGKNAWRQLFKYYAGTTPAPLTCVYKVANADEADFTAFYTTAETANCEVISIRDVQSFVDSGIAALTVNVTAAARTFIRTTGSWVTNGFVVGMQIQPSGFTNAANNYIRQIESITTTSNANDTIKVTSGTGLVNESGNANERLISYPFSSNISGGGVGSTFDGYTTSNAALYRNALPQVTTTKDDCLILYACAPDTVSVPSIIEGPCQLIAGKDGAAHSDGMAWGYQKTAGITPATVYMTQMIAYVTEMAVLAVNPGSTVVTRPAYTAYDTSAYINPFTGAAFGTDSVPAATLTTPFTGKINNRAVANGGTTVTRADTGINSYHAMTNFTGVATNATWGGIRAVIASRDLSDRNILFHIQPYLPVDIQTTDSVSLNGTCGVAIGFSSAAGKYKVWHVGGTGVYGDTQRHQPVVINPRATAGLLAIAGSFAVSGGSGTFVAGNYIYVGSTWATATKRATITSVSGSSPTQTINYSMMSGYGYQTDITTNDAIKEWTLAGANGATGTAGAPTVFDPGAVVDLGLMVSGKIVAPNWLIGSIWRLYTYVIVGGIAAEPMDLTSIVRCYAAGHERRSAIQQGSKQALFLGPIQIGDGTNFTYLKLDATAIEFPTQYNKDAKQVYYNSIDNACGMSYYAASGDTIIHKNSVVSSSSRYSWGLHGFFSTSVTPDFSGTSIIGAGTVYIAVGVTIDNITINDYSVIYAARLTLTNSTILNVPTTNDSFVTI